MHIVVAISKLPDILYVLLRSHVASKRSPANFSLVSTTTLGVSAGT
jgi:hypothetical protein